MPRMPPQIKSTFDLEITKIKRLRLESERTTKLMILATMAIVNYMNRFAPDKRLIKDVKKTIKAL